MLESRQLLAISATDDHFVVASGGTLADESVLSNDAAVSTSTRRVALLDGPSRGYLGSGDLEEAPSSGLFDYTPYSNQTGLDELRYRLYDFENRAFDFSDAAAYDRFGDSVAVSGEFAVVGAPDAEDGVLQNTGLAYVYQWNGDDWQEFQVLKAGDAAAEADFGDAVAIDGGRMVIGAPNRVVGGAIGSGASYVFEFNGVTWAQTAQLTPPNGTYSANNALYGASVAIDGGTVVVGAPLYDVSVSDAGAAYVYEYDAAGDVWSTGTALSLAAPNSNDQFGWSVAVEGDLIAVGAWTDDIAATNAGSVTTYRNVSGAWTRDASEITASGAVAGDLFGSSLAIDDGRIAVGAYGSNAYAGAAFILKPNGSSWTQTEVSASDGNNFDLFGAAIDLDGDTLVVGAYGDDFPFSKSNAGSAYVFREVNSGWFEANKLVPDSYLAGDYGGFSVAAIDDDMAVFGIQKSDAKGTDSGGVAIFELLRDDATVTIDVLPTGTTAAAADDVYVVEEDASLTHLDALANDLGAVSSAYLSRAPEHFKTFDFSDPTDFSYTPSEDYVGVDAFTYTLRELTERRKTSTSANAFDYFGYSVAMDGDVAVIGSPLEDDGGTDKGATYVYRWNGKDWVAAQRILGEAAGDKFGSDVAVDGGRIVVGAFNYDREIDVNTQPAGAAYVLEYDGAEWPDPSLSNKLTYTGIDQGDWYGWQVAIDGDVIAVGAPYDDPSSNVNAGSVFLYTWNGATWEGALLAGNSSDHTAYDSFGYAVDVDGTSIAVGARYDDYSSGSNDGSVFVFENQSGTWTQVARRFATASGGTSYDEFGSSVGLSGNFLAVGAAKQDVNSKSEAGAAYVFEKVSGTWETTPELLEPDLAKAQGNYGRDVALDGDTLVVSSHHDDLGGSNAGAAFVYRYDGDDWVQQHKPTGTAAGKQAGWSVAAVWGDTLLLGAPFDSEQGTSAGAASFFEFHNGSVLIEVLPGDNDAPVGGSTVALGTVDEDAPDMVVMTCPHRWNQYSS